MKKLVIVVVGFFTAFSANAQQPNPAYDSSLARLYEADEYGMKMYVLVLLKTGTNSTADKKLSDSLFAGHMKNIGRLVSEGKLIIAGPLKKNEQSYRGIFILNVKNIDEAGILLQTDPAIKEKLLDAELYNWYGSAALPAYLEVSEKVGKQKF